MLCKGFAKCLCKLPPTCLFRIYSARLVHLHFSTHRTNEASPIQQAPLAADALYFCLNKLSRSVVKRASPERFSSVLNHLSLAFHSRLAANPDESEKKRPELPALPPLKLTAATVAGSFVPIDSTRDNVPSAEIVVATIDAVSHVLLRSQNQEPSVFTLAPASSRLFLRAATAALLAAPAVASARTLHGETDSTGCFSTSNFPAWAALVALTRWWGALVAAHRFRNDLTAAATCHAEGQRGLSKLRELLFPAVERDATAAALRLGLRVPGPRTASPAAATLFRCSLGLEPLLTGEVLSVGAPSLGPSWGPSSLVPPSTAPLLAHGNASGGRLDTSNSVSRSFKILSPSLSSLLILASERAASTATSLTPAQRDAMLSLLGCQHSLRHEKSVHESSGAPACAPPSRSDWGRFITYAEQQVVAAAAGVFGFMRPLWLPYAGMLQGLYLHASYRSHGVSSPQSAPRTANGAISTPAVAAPARSHQQLRFVGASGQQDPASLAFIRDAAMLLLRLRHVSFGRTLPDDTLLVRLLQELAAVATSPHPREAPAHWTGAAAYLDQHLARAAAAAARCCDTETSSSHASGSPGFEFRFVRARHLAPAARSTSPGGVKRDPRRQIDHGLLLRMAAAVNMCRPYDSLALRLLQALALQEEEDTVRSGATDAGPAASMSTTDSPPAPALPEDFSCLPLPESISSGAAGADALDADLGLVMHIPSIASVSLPPPAAAPPASRQGDSASRIWWDASKSRRLPQFIRLTQEYCDRFDTRTLPSSTAKRAAAAGRRASAGYSTASLPQVSSLHSSALHVLGRLGYALPRDACVPQSQAAALAYLDARCDDVVRAARILSEAAVIVSRDDSARAAAAAASAASSAAGGESDGSAAAKWDAAAADADAVLQCSEAVSRKTAEATECIDSAATAQLLPPRVCARMKMALLDAVAACASRGAKSLPG